MHKRRPSLNISRPVYQENIYTARVYPANDMEKRSIASWSPLSSAIFGSVKRSLRVPSHRRKMALYPSSGSVRVRRNDSAGITMRISKTDCVGGRASDLWCNANLSEFYSPPPRSLHPLFSFSPFLIFLLPALSRRRLRGEQDEKKGRSRNDDDCARILPDS